MDNLQLPHDHQLGIANKELLAKQKTAAPANRLLKGTRQNERRAVVWYEKIQYRRWSDRNHHGAVQEQKKTKVLLIIHHGE